jgi:hypothetical protein
MLNILQERYDVAQKQHKSRSNEYCATIWPHGGFGAAKNKKYKPSGTVPSNTRCDDYIHPNILAFRAHGLDAARVAVPLACQASLTLTASQKPKQRRGLKGITPHGRKVLRSAAYRLKEVSGTRNLSFVTLTVPGANRDVYGRVAKTSSQWLRVFQQKLTRELKRHGLSGEMCGCLEIQPSRFKRTGDAVLHVHMVFQGRKPGKHWALTPAEIRYIWQSVLSHYVPELRDADFSASENVQAVKKDPGAYLGKYMSKGGDEIAQLSEQMPEALPKSWYFCSLKLRQWVLSHRVRLTHELAQTFMNWIEDGKSGVIWIRSVKITLADGNEIAIGKYGQIKTRDVGEWREMASLYRESLIEHQTLRIA